MALDDKRTTRLVTYASPLDINMWSRHHKVAPLHKSLNPVAGLRQAGFEQEHHCGVHDDIVPCQWLSGALGTDLAGRSIVRHDMGHGGEWERIKQ